MKQVCPYLVFLYDTKDEEKKERKIALIETF